MGFFMKIKFLLPILLLCSFFAHLIQTNWGQTSITLERLDTENNQYLYYDLYKPANATSTSKAPLIAVIPGFQRSKEALSNVAIELSRRGHVVALIDPYAQGLSSSSSYIIETIIGNKKEKLKNSTRMLNKFNIDLGFIS